MDWGKAGETYDFDNMATYAHGVGPDSRWVMYWPSTETTGNIDLNTESLFINEMHKRDLQVHPFTLRDDDLKYTSTPADETTLFVTKGIDGIFTEFVHATYSIFEKI